MTTRRGWLTAGCLLMTAPARMVAAASPWDDAVAVWHMAGPEDSAGDDSRLTVHGEVMLGTKLDDSDAAASRARGGDGVAADIRGGWLAAGSGVDGELDQRDETISILIRVRDPSGRWAGPLVTKSGGPARVAYALRSVAPASGMLFTAEIGTTKNAKPMEARVPADLVDAAGWHDVVMVCDGAKMRLFVDGLWQDEDFMLGTLRPAEAVELLIGGDTDAEGKVTGGLTALVDHVAIWRRPLAAREIEALSGGPAAVEAGRTALNEKLQVPMQYYKPHHPDWNVGDCLPMWHDDTFHFYYLGDKRHHGSKNGLGAHQWAHVSSRDLKHWTFHDFAVPVSEQWEGSICTGSMYWYDGLFHAFYATRRTDTRAEYLSHATSRDGIVFEKLEPNPFAGPEPPYVVGPFRDPTVFRDPATGMFHMLVTAALEKPALHRRGDCLAHLTSRDLRAWKQEPPLVVPGIPGAPECPDVFEWNGHWYLIFSNGGTARYRMAKSPLGPWTRPRVDTFGGKAEWVMKTAAFGPRRRLGVAWMGKGGWAGNAVFRELVQHQDGTLGTKFPAEMALPTGEPLPLAFEPLTPGATATGGLVRVGALPGMAAGFVAGIPQEVRITARVVPGAAVGWFGICVHGAGEYASGTELRITPNLARVEVRDPLAGGNDLVPLQTIDDVAGLDRPFTLEMVLKEDMVDVCIDDRRTLMCRPRSAQGDRLFFFCQDGDVTFEDIEVRPLIDPRKMR